MTSEAQDATEGRFSLVAGGPFHRILARARLIGKDQLPTRRAATILALLVWLPPASLAVAQWLLGGASGGLAIFADATAYTRFLAAVWVMVATERYAEARIVLLVRHFSAADIIGEAARPAFLAALAKADRRTSSAVAELVLIALTFAWSIVTVDLVVSQAGTAWEGAVVDGRIELSWAGRAVQLWSTPLFLFLVLRWIWRFVVWTALLFRISRLPLQLSPLHPDRSAGLGFLSIYPSIFSGFVFALSCVIASAFLRELQLASFSSDTVWSALAAWVAALLVIFLGPLMVFVRPLYRLRERSLLEYGRLAHHHHLSFHRKWIDSGARGEDLLGSPDPSSVSDLNASAEMVWSMRIVPLDLSAVVQLVLSAGTPLLAVVATQIPLLDLASWILGTLL